MIGANGEEAAVVAVVTITEAHTSPRPLARTPAHGRGRVPDQDRGRPRVDPANTIVTAAAGVAVVGITRALVASGPGGQDRVLDRILLQTRRPRTRTRIVTESAGSILVVVDAVRRIAKIGKRTKR